MFHLVFKGFGDRKRCFQPSIVDANRQCNEAYTINPQNEYTVERNDELSKASKGRGQISGSSYQSTSFQESSSGFESGYKEAVQVAPQHVNLKLRISK